MKLKPLVIGLVIACLLSAAGYGLYTFGMQRGMVMATSASVPAAGAASTPQGSSAATGAVPQRVAEGEEATRRQHSSGLKAGDSDPGGGKNVLYDHDPMVPGNQLSQPDKTHFMG